LIEDPTEGIVVKARAPGPGVVDPGASLLVDGDDHLFAFARLKADRSSAFDPHGCTIHIQLPEGGCQSK
jgi:hypothetical protein